MIARSFTGPLGMIVSASTADFVLSAARDAGGSHGEAANSERSTFGVLRDKRHAMRNPLTYLVAVHVNAHLCRTAPSGARAELQLSMVVSAASRTRSYPSIRASGS